ncbi:MAG: hypothetical protein H5T62_06160 [Anaerolineae bacterium]|nr:hypothetical protein [Anaerolineae bacterium]
MRRTWFYPVLAVVVVTAVLLTSCQPTPAPTSPPATQPPSATPTPTSPPPAERKVITIIFTQEPAVLNPFYSNMWFEAILQQLWGCWAWEFDNQNEAFPRLVTEIPSMENGGVSEDGLTITMHLRDDIVWSDGTPITSADFVFTYDMVMNAANTVATQYPYDSLESIEAPDERTVVMHFAEPFAAWLAGSVLARYSTQTHLRAGLRGRGHD